MIGRARWNVSVLLFLVLGACSGSSDKGSVTDDSEATDDSAGGQETGEGWGEASDRPNGDYLLGFSIAAVGGLTIPFQAEMHSLVEEDGAEVLSELDLRATDGVDAVSDTLATAVSQTYDADGGVVVDLGAFTLPGAYSPTGGDVDLELTLDIQSSSADGFCGEASGQIVTFGLDLAGSTFGATPWDARADGADTACEGSQVDLTPLTADQCPALTEGTNTDFPSGPSARSFQVVLPADYDPSTSYPLVFVFHGFGGDGQSMLDSGAGAWADTGEAIVVAPDGSDVGGEQGWDVFNDESSNVDILFFDDLLTCVSNTWNVDLDRVHATGMSNGGLFTGLLIGRRSAVLASAAPLSGGLLGDMADDFQPMPVQVLWGGASDQAYDVDFNAAALDLIALLRDEGSFVVQCEHDEGHTLESSFWDFTFPFLLDHPMGVSPEPYADGLPDVYPDWCSIAE